MALGIAHVVMTASSEAGKNKNKEHTKSKKQKFREEQKDSLKKEHSAEHVDQSEQGIEQKTPLADYSDESNENSILGEGSEKALSRQSSNTPPVIEVTENVEVSIIDQRPFEDIKVFVDAPVSSEVVLQSASQENLAVQGAQEKASKDSEVEKVDALAVNQAPVLSQASVVHLVVDAGQNAAPQSVSQENLTVQGAQEKASKDLEAEKVDAPAVNQAPVLSQTSVVHLVVDENPELAPISVAFVPEESAESPVLPSIVEEELKKLEDIRCETQNAGVAAEVIIMMKDMILSSPACSEAQRSSVAEMVDDFLQGVSLPHEHKALVLSALKKVEACYEEECTRHETELNVQIEALRTTTLDLAERATLGWYAKQIIALQADKAKAEKLFHQAELDLPKVDAALADCTDATKKAQLLAGHDLYTQCISGYPDQIAKLDTELEKVSNFKNNFLRVMTDETTLKELDSKIAVTQSEAERQKLQSDKDVLEASLKKDQSNAYYAQLNALKITQAEQEHNKRRTEEALKHAIEKKEYLKNFVNFYDLNLDDYLKFRSEKAQAEQSLEAEKAESKKKAAEIARFQLDQANLRRTIRALNEELDAWKSHKKKKGIFSKMNPFKLFKRKHRGEE